MRSYYECEFKFRFEGKPGLAYIRVCKAKTADRAMPGWSIVKIGRYAVGLQLIRAADQDAAEIRRAVFGHRLALTPARAEVFSTN